MGDTEAPTGSFHLIDSLRLWLFPPFLVSMKCHTTGVPYGFTSGYPERLQWPMVETGRDSLTPSGANLTNERQEMRDSWRIHCSLCPLTRWSEVGSCCTDSTEMPCVATDQLLLSYAPLCLCFLLLLAALIFPPSLFPWDCISPQKINTHFFFKLRNFKPYSAYFKSSGQRQQRIIGKQFLSFPCECGTKWK